MPSFSSTIQAKLVTLRGLRSAGTQIEAHEMVKIDWPSTTNAIWYAVHQTDEVASVSPVASGATPIKHTLIPGSSPDWFLPVNMSAEIGDEETDLTFWNGDGAFTTLMDTYGEGVRCSLYYWFPQVTLLLEMWHGHLRYESSIEPDRVTVKAVQGFRDAEGMLPRRGQYDTCQALYPPQAGMTTQAQIDEGGCPRNVDIGGAIGTPGILTCDRLSPASCTARGINPLYHLSHYGASASVVNNQTHGPRLYSVSNGNETNLKDPVRVVMGTKRLSGCKLVEYRRDYNNNHPDQGWFLGLYGVCEGPIQGLTNPIFQVGGSAQFVADAAHGYGYTLGAKGQVPITDMSSHGYSSTVLVRYHFGWINPGTVDPNEPEASVIVQGLNDIRIYSTTTVYTTGYTTNRVWQILKMLADKRWGYGLDYSRFDLQTWIDAADWADDTVRYTDVNGTNWDHVRSESHVELVGRKLADQINDMCLAGRLSRPYLFNGKICISPYKALSAGELAAAPVFVDDGGLIHGVTPNIVWEGGKTTVRVLPRLSDLDLPNRIEATIDDQANTWQQTPVPPMEDQPAQLAAGIVVGDYTRKVNVKQYTLLGVTNRAQAVKVEAGLMDLGPFDEGGLRNNVAIGFKIWFVDALDLYPTQVIKVLSAFVGLKNFSYFRIKKIVRNGDLTYSLECQAYNATYMNSFETAHSVTDDGLQCTLDTDCPDGQVCVNGRCVPADICLPTFGAVTYSDGQISININPC